MQKHRESGDQQTQFIHHRKTSQHVHSADQQFVGGLPGELAVSRVLAGPYLDYDAGPIRKLRAQSLVQRGQQPVQRLVEEENQLVLY